MSVGAVMDVIVNPIRSSRTDWSLDDRLGRHHGMIHQSAGRVPFEIEPEPTSALLGVNRAHMTLAEAMSAIARRMGGTCELNSHDWD
jgi:hypothetical protein